LSLELLRAIENVALAALLITIMYTDWRFLRIPNAFTYPAMLVGVVTFDPLPSLAPPAWPAAAPPGAPSPPQPRLPMSRAIAAGGIPASPAGWASRPRSPAVPVESPGPSPLAAAGSEG